MKKLAAIVLAAAFVAPGVAQQSPSDHSAHPPVRLSDGEVRKVDKKAKRITIKHGPLANLDMPAMTMVYRVKDPALLDQVKAGDKVKFHAEKVGRAFTVTKIQAVD
jgi:Cu/Ag efflux protein CusF